MYVLDHSWLIPALPLAAAAVALLVGDRLGEKLAPVLTMPAILYGAVHAAILGAGLLSGQVVFPETAGPAGPFYQATRDWFFAGPFRFELGVLVDGTSATLLCVVTVLSFLIQLYSLGYMRKSPRFNLYFAVVSLFTGGMLLATIANNVLQFFIGWEIMGLCSYLLIGFDYERDAAAAAGRKAFLTTRLGDLGFMLGIFLLFTTFGTLNIVQLGERASSELTTRAATTIALLLFCGSVGKSAQMPLHVWLPDAMEGPTPVSALIHAATMVAAGVYLVVRFFFIFSLSPVAMDVVGWVGGLTALVAASSALTAGDIKKVLAYSTISQLGFMFAALGGGRNPSAAMFHLTTHAFFKGLLFLGAGSVIHALHTNDLWKMGGLAKKMPLTAITFAAGWLAIIAVPLTSGYFSKEAVLHAVYERQPALFWVLAFTAFLTSFYMTRLVILAFLGDTRDPTRFAQAHESPASMTFPLVLLAGLSLFAGGLLHYNGNWGSLIQGLAPAGAETANNVVLLASIAALIAGVGLAASMYSYGSLDPAALSKRFPGIHSFLTRRYADDVYAWIIKNTVNPLALLAAKLDYQVLDQGLVDGVGRLGRRVAGFKSWVDDKIVDGIFVNGWGTMSQSAGILVRRLQSGAAQFYLLAAAFGLSLLVLWAARAFR